MDAVTQTLFCPQQKSLSSKWLLTQPKWALFGAREFVLEKIGFAAPFIFRPACRKIAHRQATNSFIYMGFGIVRLDSQGLQKTSQCFVWAIKVMLRQGTNMQGLRISRIQF